MKIVDWLKEFFAIGDEYAEDRKHLGRIFAITGPAFVELFLTSIMSSIDMAMIGRLDPIAMTGVGLTNQPLFLLIAIFQSVNVGTTTLVSWSVGEGNKKRAGYILKQTLILNVVLGIILTVIGTSITPALMRFMAKDQQTVAYATEYMMIICTSLIFLGITMGITAALRGMGETQVPMLYNIVANVVNVILNYLLIYGKFGFPKWGVAGGAWATVIGRGVACLLALFVVFFWRKSPLRVNLKGGLKPDFEVYKEFFSIGLPAAGEQFVIQSGLMLFSKLVISIGVIEAAAHQIIGSINSLAFSVSQAFAISNTALVGQAVGANDYERAEKNTKLSRKAARFTSIAIAIILIAFAKPLASIYTDSKEVIDTAVPLFIFIALIQFSQSSQMCFSGALRGSGDTTYPLFATFIGIWGIRLTLAYVFVKVLNFGLIGAWLAFLLDQTTRNLLVKRRFDSGVWRDAKAKKEAKKRERELNNN